MPIYDYALTLRDDSGNDTRKSIQLTAADFAAARTAANAWRGLFLACTNLDWVQDYLTETAFNSSITPASGSQVGFDAVITLALETAGKKATFAIPSPDAGIKPSGTNTVDLTDTDLVALIDDFKLAGSARISDGEAVQSSDPILRGALRSTSRRFK